MMHPVHVVEVSAKKCHFTPCPPSKLKSLQICNFRKLKDWISSESEKLGDLELLSQVGFLDFRFKSATLHNS